MIQFAGGARVELQTGALQPSGTSYQTYEVVGTRGRLRRAGDAGPLVIHDDQAGGWREVSLPREPLAPFESSLAPAVNYLRLAAWIRGEGSDHPLSGASALRGHEILMAIYESARRRERVKLPLGEERFPLDLLLAGNVS